MENKTEAIIEMFTSERPQCNLIKGERYKDVDNPYEVFRDWLEKFFQCNTH
jgi:hypothetical protein